MTAFLSIALGVATLGYFLFLLVIGARAFLRASRESA